MMYRSLGQYKQALLMQEEVHKSAAYAGLKRFILLGIAILLFGGGLYGALSQWSAMQQPKYIGKAYYISTNGSDSNDGLTAQTAWKSIDKVNLGSYRVGDQILFEGGKTFTGTLELYAGAIIQTGADTPLTISSYGHGRATILGQDGRAIYIVNAGNVTIDTLNVVGNALGCNNYNYGVYMLNFGGKRMNRIRVNNVEASGFCVGVAIISNSPSSIDTVSLNNVVAHDNTEFGIEVIGYDTKNPLGSGISNVSISHSVAFNNKGHAGSTDDIKRTTGGGIVVYGVDSATIDHNSVFDNGGNTSCTKETPIGPAGIWAVGTNFVIEQNELFRQQKSAPCAMGNGAISVTGTHITVQHNYSHDNAGPALVLQTEIPRRDIIIRYNISENDAAKTSQGVFDSTGQVNDVEVYNNTIYSGRTDQSRGPMIAVRSATTIGDRSKPFYHMHFRNNIFLTQNDAVAIRVDDPENANDILFQNNEYFDRDGTARVIWGKETFAAVVEWARRLGQEKIGNDLSLKVTNPLLCNVGGGGTVYPKSLDSLKAYTLQSISPLIDQGVDVWGMEVSSADFRNLSIKSDAWGNPTPSGATFDIGANEFVNGQTCQ